MDLSLKQSKPFWQSKRVWTTVVGVVCFIAQSQFGYVIDPAIQVQILGVIQLILIKVSHHDIDWKF
jgi:hypothetical protein